jgi:hypothetical protein
MASTPIARKENSTAGGNLSQAEKTEKLVNYEKKNGNGCLLGGSRASM